MGTDRILGEQKSQGTFLSFRNLKSNRQAITLFSNKEAIEVVTMPDYEAIAREFDEALELEKVHPPIKV
jgi:type I restriction enzyme R subunit